MRVLKFLVRFIVGKEGLTFFDVSENMREQGVVVLHRVFMDRASIKDITSDKSADEGSTAGTPKASPQFDDFSLTSKGSVASNPTLIDDVLSYFAYALQTFFVTHFEHRYSSKSMLLFYAALQSSLRGMACIASYESSRNSVYTKKVLEVVRNKNVWKEVEELLKYPNVKADESFAHKIDAAEAAAALVGSICLVPEEEGHSIRDKESLLEYKDDVANVEEVREIFDNTKMYYTVANSSSCV
jgi:hypothetical protein